jgi:hypothetical protein
MEIFTEEVLWFLAAYVAGSVVTGWMVYKSQTIDVVGKTIDALCEAGYIKHKKASNGEIELMQWDAKDE